MPHERPEPARPVEDEGALEQPQRRQQQQQQQQQRRERQPSVGRSGPAVHPSSFLLYCTACGTQVSMDAAFCDHCGLPLKKRLLSALGDSGAVVVASTAAETTPMAATLPAADPAATLPSPTRMTWLGSPPWPGVEASPMLADAGFPTAAAAERVGDNGHHVASGPSSPPAPAAAPLSWTTQRWVAPGAALASLLVLALGSVIWQAAAPPPTSQEVLDTLRGNGKGGAAKMAAPSPDLLCLRNLPYHRHHIQVQPTDQATRDWMDALVRAGLYAPAVEVIPEGLSRDTLLQYQTLPAINPWRRGGRLCVAQNWVFDSVVPDSIRKDVSVQPARYVAALVWRAEGVAPWLVQVPEVGGKLAGVRVEGGRVTTRTLEGVGDSW